MTTPEATPAPATTKAATTMTAVRLRSTPGNRRASTLVPSHTGRTSSMSFTGCFPSAGTEAFPWPAVPGRKLPSGALGRRRSSRGLADAGPTPWARLPGADHHLRP